MDDEVKTSEDCRGRPDFTAGSHDVSLEGRVGGASAGRKGDNSSSCVEDVSEHTEEQRGGEGGLSLGSGGRSSSGGSSWSVPPENVCECERGW